MAENINALILPIGADPSQFQKSINDVKAAYKDLSTLISNTPFNLVTEEQKTLLGQYGQTIKTLTNDVKQFGAALGPPANSIAGLDKKISELNKKKINLDAKTSASEIARLTKEIEKLTNQRNNIDALGASVQKIGQGAGNSFKKLEDSSKGGRIALTSLSLVAQDLPFGFIAIQNNLPSVIQSFGQLSTQSGGLKKALSTIGPLLLGPAGLFLAFSIVTSAVTLAVQKYGSLGAALDAIIGKQSKYSELLLEANKSYEKFNKEKRDSIQISNEEVASIQGSISKAISLASIVTDITKSYNERNSALNDLKSLDKERFGNLDIEKTKLEDLKSALDNYISSLKAAAITKGFESAIGQTSVELAKQLKILDSLKDELADAKAAPVTFIGKADQIDTRDIDAATARIKEQDKVVKTLRDDISLYNKEIDNSIKLQNSLQAPIDAANKAIADQAKNAAKSGKDLSKQDKDYERFLELTRQSNLRLAEFYATQLKIQADKNLQKKLKEDAAAFKLLEQATLGANDANNQFGIGLQNQIAGIDTTYANAAIATGQIIQRFTDAQNVGTNEFARIQEQLKAFDKLKSTIESNLTKPFREFFDELLTNGKVSFDGFVDLAKDAFKRILAQAIASGIANLIASLLSGGATAGLGKLGAAKGIAGILSGLGKTGGLLGSANFSGVQGGGMQMAGSVNLSLRGSDLVGSINRTNSTINRVG